MNKLILASGSPRRIEILKRLGIVFESIPQDIDERFTGRSILEEAAHIAEKKALSYINQNIEGRKQWVLAADTFVVSGNNYLGKPEDRSSARKMLKMLSGKTHQVVTGLALNVPEKGIMTETCLTDVTFAPMSQAEIEWYLDQNEWQGAAAAYRIQEKGALFIESISGSYSNVMGLPINTFYGILSSNNFNFRTINN